MAPCMSWGPAMLFLLLCGWIICASSDQIKQQHTQAAVQEEQSDVNIEITENTFLTFIAPISSRVKNQKCRNDSLLYIQHLRNLTLWATKMFDASAKLPVGLLAGNTYQLGHFDECLQVGYEEAPTDVVPVAAPVQGQYCLARLQLSPRPQTYPGFTRKDVPHAFSLQYDPNLSAWEKFMIPIDPSKKRRDVFHTAVCVPASCDPQDVETSMRAALEPVQARHGINIVVSVNEKLCQTNISKPLSTADIFIIIILLVAFLVVLGCSAYDMIIYRQRPKEESKELTRREQMVISFSAYSNLEKLNKPDPTDEMGILHGLRLLSMVVIILGHRCLFSYGGPFFNPEFLEERYRKIEDMFLLNGTLLVDTFFVLSGFLTCFGILLEIHKRKTLKIGMLYLYRWMRLTPVYMMVVAFYATLLDKIDTGPIWNAKVGSEKQRCVDNWWTNLFYINNYVNSDRLCMFQSWYIACDMHYFLIAPLIVLPLYRKPPLGMAILGGVILLTIIVPFVVTYVGGYIGVLRVYMSLLEDPPSNEEYFNVYIKSHNRAAPYFIGMAAAYLFGIMKLNQMKIPIRWMWICSLIATILGLSALFGAWIFYIPGREHHAFENAAYASLHRIAWALTVVWIIIGGCTTRFNVLQPILQLHAFLPLSRLTYSAFLVHGAVQLYFLGTLRQPEYMSFPKLFWMASGDITISFIVALFVYLLFEAPLGGIQKMLLRGRPQKSATNGVKNANIPLQNHNGHTPVQEPETPVPPTQEEETPVQDEQTPADTQELEQVPEEAPANTQQTTAQIEV